MSDTPMPSISFTASIINTLSTAIAATTTTVLPTSSSAAAIVYATPSPSVPSTEPRIPDAPMNELLCDWTRTAANCRDAEFIRYMLWASSALHLAAGLYGVWLLVYRNRGLNRKIFADLFTYVGTGIRPRPMDCIIFFTTIACFVKVPANMPIIFNVLQDSFWLRIAIEQLYWSFVAFAFSAYFVGLLYAMPVTTREGIFAVYQPETAYGSRPLSPIHVLTPTTVQKNVMLVMGAIYPSLFGAGLGVASGALHDRGNTHASRILMLCQYANWVLILYVMAVMFFYYGLKYTFILRANIIIAETALKAPRAAFGIGNLKSRSPARFLFIQLQITGFGGCAVTILAGTLCLLWVLFQRQILEMKNDQLPHTMAFFWTCAMAIAFFVVMALITAQSVRNRKRGLHEPSSTMSNTCSPSPGHGSGGPAPDARSGRSGGSLQKQGSLLQSFTSKGSKQIMSRFDPEACLTHESSGDVSTLHSVITVEKRSMDLARDRNDNGETEGCTESDRDSYKAPSLTPPPRPLNLYGDSSVPRTTASVSADPNHSQIRESVFGGRTPREETSRGAASPPQSPTSGGFSLPSFPLASLRSGSRNSVLPRPSTSSTSGGSPSYHTTSISTMGSSSRLSRSSSIKHGGSSASSHHVPSSSVGANHLTTTPTTSPTQSSFRWSSNSNGHQQQQQPSSPSLHQSPSSPPTVYSPQPHPRQSSQPIPQLGGAVRKQSNAGMSQKSGRSGSGPLSLSAPIPVPPSRGAGGGYRSQGIELEAIQHHQQQQLSQLQQFQQQQRQMIVSTEMRVASTEDDDDGSEGVESWPLPPTFSK